MDFVGIQTVASLVSDRPDRFGLFATVPLPGVVAATEEAIRALDHLRADGLILLANAAGSSDQSRYQVPDGDDQGDEGGRDVLAVISSSLVRD